MNHLDQFSAPGAFSGISNYPDTDPIDPAAFLDGKFMDAAGLNKKFRLLFIGLGAKEPSPFPGSIGAFRNMLDKQGIKYHFYESPATAHEWQTWRKDLYQFSALLFKN